MPAFFARRRAPRSGPAAIPPGADGGVDGYPGPGGERTSAGSTLRPAFPAGRGAIPAVGLRDTRAGRRPERHAPGGPARRDGAPGTAGPPGAESARGAGSGRERTHRRRIRRRRGVRPTGPVPGARAVGPDRVDGPSATGGAEAAAERAARAVSVAVPDPYPRGRTRVPAVIRARAASSACRGPASKPAEPDGPDVARAAGEARPLPAADACVGRGCRPRIHGIGRRKAVRGAPAPCAQPDAAPVRPRRPARFPGRAGSSRVPGETASGSRRAARGGDRAASAPVGPRGRMVREPGPTAVDAFAQAPRPAGSVHADHAREAGSGPEQGRKSCGPLPAALAYSKTSRLAGDHTGR